MAVRTYQLYLSTLITSPTTNNIVPINVTNKGNATWQVDFKSLFGNDYNRFKRCVVRIQLHSQSWNAANTDENTYDGYITLGLPSTYTASTSAGVPVALINPSLATYATTPQSFYDVSTLSNVQGTDINFPGENQLLNIRFYSNDAFTGLSSIPDYQILIQFELSEPKE